MRKKLLQGCLSAREARKRAPWAAVVVQADGGYWAFESAHDAARWRSQNKPMPRQEGRLAPRAAAHAARVGRGSWQCRLGQ
jgi:hypothetical protein